MTVRDYVVKWLAWKRDDVRAASYDKYSSSLGHLVEAFGGRELQELTFEHLMDWKAARLGVAARSTVRDEIVLARRMFNCAVAQDHLWRNPAEGLTLPRKRREPKPLDARFEDVRIGILCHLSGHAPYDAALMLLLYSGMRVGELTSLRWIDCEGSLIRIRRHPDGWEPKTDERVIPKCRDAVSALKNLQRHAPPGGKWVLNLAHQRTGERLAPEPARRRLERKLHHACREQDLVELTLQNLRGLFIVHALDLGTNPRVVQKIVGHKSLEVTMMYLRAPAAGVREAMENFF